MQKIFLSLFIACSLNLKAQSIPPTGATAAKEEQIWNKYCGGNRKSTDVPLVNYKNSEVISAVKKLTMISPMSYYFYSGPLIAYGLRIDKDKTLIDVPNNFPDVPEVKMGRKNAHAFLTLLCGEFRDRPTLIQDKVKWVNQLFILPNIPQRDINVKNEIWSQMSAQSYSKYIKTTRNIFASKKLDVRQGHPKKAVMGKYSEDFPIEPFSVCETKFIFKKYVAADSQYELNTDLKKNSTLLTKYRSEYEKFKPNCPTEDLEYFYDFRGDSNFKPNSPESNGMIWFSSTISNSCVRQNGKMVLKEAVKDKFMDQKICEKYFLSPFTYRWSAARAGLGAWLMYDPKYENVFSSSGSKVTIMPHFEPMTRPFKYSLASGEVFNFEEEKWTQAQKEFWKRSDMGFNDVVGFSKTQKSNRSYPELAYERLRNSVNRHTDWYASGYDDGLGTVKDQAYSPFVASSYEMSASDAFTAPGTTVKSPSDGCKHWMFIFKLRNDQWYNTQSISNHQPLDFNLNWFDETSLGTNHLADTEHALDRLGTALEGEMDSILYLHNINESGEAVDSCGAEQMKVE